MKRTIFILISVVCFSLQMHATDFHCLKAFDREMDKILDGWRIVVSSDPLKLKMGYTFIPGEVLSLAQGPLLVQFTEDELIILEERKWSSSIAVVEIWRGATTSSELSDELGGVWIDCAVRPIYPAVTRLWQHHTLFIIL